MTRQQDIGQGYARSDVATFTIADGADGSAVDPVDLSTNYLYCLIKCEDCQYIAASTSLTALVGYDDSDTMSVLYELNDPGTQWSKGDLPTSGTLAFAMTNALGAQRIRFVLSNAASGGSVVFKVYGIGASRNLS